jgi:hypothetical protein
VSGYIEDFSAVPPDRYAEAQSSERSYWSARGRVRQTREALYPLCVGYYRWRKHGALIDPFRRKAVTARA